MNREQAGMNPEREEKERIWEEALIEVDRLADGLGRGVDEGIKEAVAAFRVHGINTVGSHEGKIDRYPVPYIDVRSAGILELAEQFDALGESPDEKMEEDLRNEIFRLNIEERRKIVPFLEKFYADRTVSYNVRLAIESKAMGWSRVQSQGADFQEIEKDDDKKKENLLAFQEEMRSFTDFLKKEFFGD